jgi:hypothetical protein
MREQRFVGSLTRLSESFQFFPRQLEFVSDQSLKLSPSRHVETDFILEVGSPCDRKSA